MYLLNFINGVVLKKNCTQAQIRQYIELNGLISYKKLY